MFQHSQGPDDRIVYTAWTRAASQSFKTEAGAVRWLQRHGFHRDGTRIQQSPAARVQLKLVRP